MILAIGVLDRRYISSQEMKPSETNPILQFWDVPAALLGMVFAGVLGTIPIWGRFGVFWYGAPLAAVLLRRKLFPMLSPPEAAAARPPWPQSRLGASILSIMGVFIAMLAGLGIFGMMKVGREDLIWIFLLPLGVGGLMATIGVRRLTHPESAAAYGRTEPAPAPTRKARRQADRRS